MVQLGIPVLSILVLKYWYPRVNQQRGTVVFPQTLQIQSDHLNLISNIIITSLCIYSAGQKFRTFNAMDFL